MPSPNTEALRDQEYHDELVRSEAQRQAPWPYEKTERDRGLNGKKRRNAARLQRRKERALARVAEREMAELAARRSQAAKKAAATRRRNKNRERLNMEGLG